MKKQIFFILGFLLLLVTGCTPVETLPKEDQLATIIAKTLAAQPTYTPIPVLTEENSLPTTNPQVIPTVEYSTLAAPSGEVFVRTTAQNVNLRTSPGTLFSVSRVMPQGTRLQVLGLSPGQEWVRVRNDEGINSWVQLWLLDEFPIGEFPILIPGNVITVTGRVLDENGLPVSGIGYAILGQSGSKSLRTDAITDATGTFYAYLPPSFSGAWTVSHVYVSCTSDTMDSNCNCLSNYCGTSNPLSQPITLPLNEPLTFIWK